MAQVCLALIEKLNSSVFTLLVILFIAFWAIYRLGLLIAKFTAQDNQINKLSDLAEKVVALTTKVDLIYDHTNPKKLYQSSSPLALTDLGRTISDAIRADEILKKYMEIIIKEATIEKWKK